MKLLTGIYFAATIIACASKNKDGAEIQTIHQTANPDSILQIQISSVGDLMCHNTQSMFAKVSADSFNYFPCFEYILPYLQTPDLMLGNLETTMAGKSVPYSGYPKFNTPDSYASALKHAGFDFLVTANNHCNDSGEKGILRTIEVLQKLQIHQTGTFTSAQDRDSIRIQDVQGIRVAVVSYTYGTNGYELTGGKPWLANLCDSILIQKDIQAARKAGAEIVIVFYHFGEEYQRTPSDYQNNFVNWAIDNGADIILGSHTHVLQPATFFKTKQATLDSGFIAYSMGNFISNQQDNYTDEGIIFNMHLEKNTNTGKITLTKVDYVPTWVYKGKNPLKKLHIVFPVMQYSVYDSLNFIGNPELQEMKLAQEHTLKLLSEMSGTIHPIEK